MGNTFIWKGGNGLWTDASQWLSTVGGTPLPGDSVVANGGTIEVRGLDLSNTSITFSNLSGSAAALLLENETLDATTVLTLGDIDLHLDGSFASRISATLSNRVTPNLIVDGPSAHTSGTLTNAGLLQLNSVTLGDGAALLNSGEVDSGTSISIGQGATVQNTGYLSFPYGGFVGAGSTVLNQGWMVSIVSLQQGSAVTLDHGATLVNTGTLRVGSIVAADQSAGPDAHLVNNGTLTGYQFTLPIEGTGTIVGPDLYSQGYSGYSALFGAVGPGQTIVLHNPLPVEGGAFIVGNHITLAPDVLLNGAFQATIVNFRHGDTISLGTSLVNSMVLDGNTLDLSFGGIAVGEIVFGEAFAPGDLVMTADGIHATTITSTVVAPCFAAGTMIATEQGELPVEMLRSGMHIRSAFGGSVPVVWIGHRHVNCRRHARPAAVWPVRLRAGALGTGFPHRDLWLSPDHAVHVDEVLVPAICLVNGGSITQEPVERITYFHVELPAHDVLLANGLPAESYLDTGNRAAFQNSRGTAIALHPDFAREAWEAGACAPQLRDGPRLDAIRAWIAGQPATAARAPATRP